MDIQVNKPNAYQNNQSAVQEAELDILKGKIQLMQIVCASFFNNEHRCLLSFIAASTLHKQVIREEDISIFQSYASLAVDLKDAYFLTTYEIYQKKESRRDKRVTCYKLNTNNFNKIIRPILTELQKRIKKIKQFYVNSQNSQNKQSQKRVQKRCKNCHAARDDYVHEFFGYNACQICHGTQFQDAVINLKQKIRIDKLNYIISIVFTKLKIIEDMQFKLKNQIQEIKQIQKQLKIKQIDRFMGPYDNFLKQKGQKVQLQLDYKAIKEAQRIHAPPSDYQRVNQMIRSRQFRQRSRERDGSYLNNPQNWPSS